MLIYVDLCQCALFLFLFFLQLFSIFDLSQVFCPERQLFLRLRLETLLQSLAKSCDVRSLRGPDAFGVARSQNFQKLILLLSFFLGLIGLQLFCLFSTGVLELEKR